MNNKLIILAVTGLILVAVGVGNAFAYTWSGTDYSRLAGNPSVSWVSTISFDQVPRVNYGGHLTWANTFDQEYSGYSYYPTLFVADRLGNWWKNARDTYLSYGQKWYPDGDAYAYAYGTPIIEVTHRWGTTRDSNEVSVTTLQRYSNPMQ
ncbi:hypothetical protein [Methanocella conradii]|uniref:hypothetical protein n=1 Tax=Methanocella conradii TaxID=1175444 RepID=UPI00157CC01A|nr:hypothetical protein [Methanocella conradii]